MSYLKQKFLTPVLFLIMFLSSAQGVFADTPGSGFALDDLCGYVLGSNTTLNANVVSDASQACMENDSNEDGYATFVNIPGVQSSFIFVNGSGFMNLTPPLASGYSSVKMNLETGYLEGYAFIPSVASSGGNPFVRFDWVCSTGGPTGSGCTAADYATYHPHVVDMEESPVWTLTGYVWSPTLGYINLDGLVIETPPLILEANLSIETLNDVAAEDVSLETAPYADGYQYYEISYYLQNTKTGKYISEGDVSNFSMNLEFVDDMVYLNGVSSESEYDFTEYYIGPDNPNIAGCETRDSEGWSYCVEQVTIDGELIDVFKYFVYAPVPSSALIGVDENLDGDVDIWTERDGCTSIYDPSPTDCYGNALSSKFEYFYQRLSDWNQYLLESVQVYTSFPLGRTYNIVNLDEVVDGEGGGGKIFEESFGNGLELLFRPRVQLSSIKSLYPVPDGALEDDIHEDVTAVMELQVEGVIHGLTQEYISGSEAAGFDSSVLTVPVVLFYKADSDYASGPFPADYYLSLDGEATQYDSEILEELTDIEYSVAYSMTYERDCPALGPCLSLNPPIDPTVEVWTCDYSGLGSPWDSRMAASLVCYFVGYLPLVDFHAEAEDMRVIGAVNSSINNETILGSQEGVSVQGDTKLRNLILEQVARLTLGQNPAGDVVLDENLNVSSGNAAVLMQGSLIYVQDGDLTISSSSDFDQKTIVVKGGNVYLDGNIQDLDGSHLGLVVLESEDGRGGNLYLKNDVTDVISVNAYLDGALYSYSDNSSLDANGVPFWTSSEDRNEDLQDHQLYWEGSLTSDNTIGAYEGSAPWEIGDGTTTSDDELAIAHDLNLHRTFSGCYPAASDGTPDTSATELEACADANFSSFENEDLTLEFAPVIFKGSPAPLSLPVLNAVRVNLQAL